MIICNLWETLTGKLLHTLHSDERYWIEAVAFTPNGTRVITADEGYLIRMYDSSYGKLIYEKQIEEFAYGITCIAISSDERTLVSGDNSQTIEVWDWQTRKLIRILQGHSGDVISVAITPDGQSIISGSEDGTIKIWGVENLPELESRE